MAFHAEMAGRYVLFFVMNNQPSNAVVIDVKSSLWPPLPPSPSNAKITLKSSWLEGYSVFVDGSYVGTDGWGSDSRDGVYSFTVRGGEYHTIQLIGMGRVYSEWGTFLGGYTYTLTI